MKIEFERDVEIAPYTTIGLGGPAAYFFRARSLAEIDAALQEAHRLEMPVVILGGGSNVIFRDEGFDGLVLRIELKGIYLRRQGAEARLEAQAGESWDSVVAMATAQGLAGLECLSGIPGLAGAAPLQNIGAYGQELGDSLVSVECIDRKSRERSVLSAAECRLSYRSSRFKSDEPDRFIITRIACRLREGGAAPIRYPELQKRLEQRWPDMESLGHPLKKRQASGEGAPRLHAGSKATLQRVRQAVLELRRQKSMLIDAETKDPNARSVGSFFINPLLDRASLERLQALCREEQIDEQLPIFPTGEGCKVAAAWIIEKAGFQRGMIRGGVGISEKHALALVNRQGTTKELLALATEIETEVERRFGITLKREAVVI